MSEDFEIAIKVVIVGNGAVGKSSMIQRYCKGIAKVYLLRIIRRR